MKTFTVTFNEEDIKNINQAYHDAMENFKVIEYNKLAGQVLGNNVYFRMIVDGRYGSNVRDGDPITFNTIQEILK